MSDATFPPAPRADRLRRLFDATFAEPMAPPRPSGRRLLLIGVAGQPCAIPLEECSGVERVTHITSLPRRHPAFCGLAAVAGSLVPVYDLAAQLGLPPDAGARWLVLSAGVHRVAHLVGAIDGYAEAESADTPAGELVITVAGTPRRIVPLAALTDELARHAAILPRS